MKQFLLSFSFSWFILLGSGTEHYELSLPQGAASVQWYVAEDFNGSFSAISGATNPVYQATESGIYYASFTLKECNNYSSYFILTSATELTDFAYPINLSAPMSADTYQWYKDGSPVGGETDSVYQVTADGDYIVHTQRNHCPYTSPLFIFRSLERIKVIAVDDIYMVDSVVGTNNIISDNVVTNNDTLPPETPYTVNLLEDVKEGTLTLNSDGSFTYSVSSFSSGLDSFKYAVCVGNLCDTATVYLEYSCARNLSAQDLMVPNLISPNNDGHNDLWEIPGLLDYKKCYEYNEVIVFNRWEVKVYHKKNYGLDGEWWDARSDRKSVIFSKESFLPSGTYYYIIVIDGNTDNSITGFIHIQY